MIQIFGQIIYWDGLWASKFPWVTADADSPYWHSIQVLSEINQLLVEPDLDLNLALKSGRF